MAKFPDKAKRVITRELPDQLIKQRDGGKGVTLSYLSGSTVIDLLNEAFDYMWDWTVQEQFVQKSEDKFNPKYDKEPKPQGPVAHVRGLLTAHITSENGQIIHVSKSGFGSKTIVGGQSEQESIFKAAGTDALKKAASMFGIGLSLWRDEDEQELFIENNSEETWTEAKSKEFASEITYLKEFKSNNELGTDRMNSIIREFDESLEGTQDITPLNIKAFVIFLEEYNLEEDS